MRMESHKISVSIIVPIYKVEEYIERCAISLFEQTLDDVEFIFVDDNTPDKSIEILLDVLQRYPSQKRKVKIIHHHKNQGLAVTRETGFKQASGRYIIHCDSDDWVDKEMYAAMYEKAMNENADIVVCDYMAEYTKKSVYFSQKCSDKKEIFICQLLSGKLHNGVWNKLISRDLYMQIPFLWKEGCNMWEDVSIISRLAFYASRISYIPKGFYHYSQINNNAYTKTLSLTSVKNILEASNIVIDFFKQKNDIFTIPLMYFKLSAKYEILSVMSCNNQVSVYRNLYAEADALLFEHPSLPFYRKILLCFWIHTFDKLAEIFLKSVLKIKAIIQC